MCWFSFVKYPHERDRRLKKHFICMGSKGSPDESFGESRVKLNLPPEGDATLVAIDRGKIWRAAVRNTLVSILFTLVGAFAISAPVFAHHGNASYDFSKTVTLKGTVTKWMWANPHCLLFFDVKDDKGAIVHWVAEASNPVDMLRGGWASTSLKPGDEITIDVMPSKNGAPVGRIRQVRFNDGTILKGGGRNSI